MTLPWCSEAGSGLTLRIVCLLFSLALPVSPAWGHADILVQIESLDIQLQQEPGNAELLVRRGDLYRRHGDYAAAAGDFRAARLADPGFPLLDFHEGRLLLEAGDPVAAELCLDRYLLAHPQDAGAWILLAEIQLALNQAIKAAQDYAMAIQHAEQPSPGLYRDWSLALVSAGEEHWSSAGNVADIGLERFAQDMSLLALGTDIALAQNRPDRAAAYIERLAPQLAQLPRWKARADAIQCLSAPLAEDDARQCLAAAKRDLEGQASP